MWCAIQYPVIVLYTSQIRIINSFFLLCLAIKLCSIGIFKLKKKKSLSNVLVIYTGTHHQLPLIASTSSTNRITLYY